MRNFVKILALLLTLATVLAMVGCVANTTNPTDPSGNPVDEPKEPVTIVYWINNGAGVQDQTDEVEAKLNEMLKADPATAHITLELHPCKEYATDVALGQTAKQQMDILMTFGLSFGTEVQNGSFMELDDLLEQYPEAIEEYPEWLVKTGMVDGSTYYVPNYQQASNMLYFVAPKEYLDMAGITVEDLQNLFWNDESRTIENVAAMYEKLLLAVREGTGKQTKYLREMITHPYLWNHISNTEVQFDYYTNFSWDTESESFELNYMNENMQAAFLKMAEWYDKGYVHPDIATVKIADYVGTNFFNDESFVASFGTGMNGDTEAASAKYTAQYGFETVAVPLYNYFYVPAAWAAGGMAISSTCEHPEEAMMIISMLTNSKYSEFYNTMVYGLEGKHYTKNNDGTITTLEFSGAQGTAEGTYTYWKWSGGNAFNAWINQSTTAELNNWILNEVNQGENTIASPFTGYTFDLSDLETYKAQMIAVTAEYQKTLTYGNLGYAATQKALEEYNSKMEAAGLSKVLAELNKQAKEWLDN